MLDVASEAGVAVVLLSAPDAGVYAGAGWWKALMGLAREAAPDAIFTAILDCGEDAGAAQGAIRAGIEALVFTGRADVAKRLSAIAEAARACVLTARPPTTLDLKRWFFADREVLRRRCAEALGATRDD